MLFFYEIQVSEILGKRITENYLHIKQKFFTLSKTIVINLHILIKVKQISQTEENKESSFSHEYSCS